MKGAESVKPGFGHRCLVIQSDADLATVRTQQIVDARRRAPRFKRDRFAWPSSLPDFRQLVSKGFRDWIKLCIQAPPPSTQLCFAEWNHFRRLPIISNERR